MNCVDIRKYKRLWRRELDQIASNEFINYLYDNGNIFECSQLSDNFVWIIAAHFMNHCAVFMNFSCQANTLQNLLGRIAMLTFRRICSGQIRHRYTVQVRT
jgi:hypothetical protein